MSEEKTTPEKVYVTYIPPETYIHSGYPQLVHKSFAKLSKDHVHYLIAGHSIELANGNERGTRKLDDDEFNALLAINQMEQLRRRTTAAYLKLAGREVNDRLSRLEGISIDENPKVVI